MKKIIFLIVFIVISNSIFAANEIVLSSDSNVRATVKFKNVMKNGGTITFRKGNFIIDLASDELSIKKNMTIVGANTTGSSTIRGAYEAPINIKTTISFKKQLPVVENGCKLLKIKNLKWVGVRLRTATGHQPVVDFSNVIFESGIPKRADINPWAHIPIVAFDGISGNISHCSFLNCGERAIYINRTIPYRDRNPVGTGSPFPSIKKITYDYCKFKPYWIGKYVISNDAGNDENPSIWNHNNKTIKNCLFVDAGISASKARNLIISNNIFRMNNSENDVLHLEEFSEFITINNNKIYVAKKYDKSFVTLGPRQSCNNITITNNEVIQTGNFLKKFVGGTTIKGIKISGNKIQNAVLNQKYVTLNGCGNTGTVSGGRGFAASNINMDRSACVKPLGNGTYYIKQGNKYLRPSLTNKHVQFDTKTTAPTNSSYKWKFTNVKGKYYEIKNVGTGNYFEIPHGATDHEGIEHTESGLENALRLSIELEVKRNFGSGRKPVWEIDKKVNSYSILPGGNEGSTELRISGGSKAFVYLLRSNALKTHNWKIVRVTRNTSIANDKEILEKDESKINVYPNPAKGNEEITLITKQTTKIEIINTTGKVFYNVNLNPEIKTHVLPANLLTNGLYIIKFSDANKGVNKIKKLIVH